MKHFKVFLHVIWILFLTALTQVGGIIWIITIVLSIKYKKKKRLIFPLIYLLFNLLIIPPIAKVFGREQLPVLSETLRSRNWIYPLFFRNYVRPELKMILLSASESLKEEGITITYLDANFPFLNGFPLMPHLSHNDGRKIDISFMYLDKSGIPTNKKPSVSGYGVYVLSDQNYTLRSCLEKGYWQYDSTKYITFGKINKLNLDHERTQQLIKELLLYAKTQKIFIEPHLKYILQLGNESNVGFHGCQTVRHDDHMHLQIK
jgi:hypothetical protein